MSSESIKNTISLMLITLIAGLLLGAVYEITKEPIRKENQKAKEEAYKAVFADADAFEDVKDRNMCIVVGGGDDIAHGKHMIMPLWNRLKEHDTVAVQKQITFDCDHCMCNVRMALAEYIAQFMKEVLGEEVCGKYSMAKKKEWNDYNATVSQWEIDSYLLRI